MGRDVPVVGVGVVEGSGPWSEMGGSMFSCAVGAISTRGANVSVNWRRRGVGAVDVVLSLSVGQRQREGGGLDNVVIDCCHDRWGRIVGGVNRDRRIEHVERREGGR